MDYDRRVAELLSNIESEMRDWGLWAEQHPGEDALASSMPFAIDRLSFPQWLQWVFLPRMRAVVACGERLPAKCQILPAAEVYLSEFPVPCGRLVALIAELDRLVPDPQPVDAGQ